MFPLVTLMVALKHALIGFLLALVVGGLISPRSAMLHAATQTPVLTATRVLHVTVKAHSTLTPTVTAAATPALGGSIEATVQAYVAQSKMPSASQPLSSTAVAPRARPVRLVIPSLKVDAVIESVGRGSDGAMDIPSKVQDVAWYALGTAPGDIGNAVIAGHLDLANGSPAVFWEIGKLRIGDEVIVYDLDGVEYHFQVTGKQRYPDDQAPLERIFGFSLRSQLNLITCAGTWDRRSHNYSNRLVVYTELMRRVEPATREVVK